MGILSSKRPVVIELGENELASRSMINKHGFVCIHYIMGGKDSDKNIRFFLHSKVCFFYKIS